MPLIASPMEPKPYSQVTRNSPVGFKPPPPPLCGSGNGSPTSPSSMGSMNYSPRHSRKPSSLSSSRNINIQRLSLNASPPQGSATTSPPKRGKPLALYIPSVASPTSSSVGSIQTPVRESSGATFPNTSSPDASEISSSCESADSIHEALSTRNLGAANNKLRSPFKSGLGSLEGSQDELAQSISQFHVGELKSESTSEYDLPRDIDSLSMHEESSLQTGSHTVAVQDSPRTHTVPEELQEIGLTYAYPHGPANVLNSVLYLYSDPQTSELPVDVNDYDLVVNVAKECRDLSVNFDDKVGSKKYLRVPWSHTSTISKELPMITREIAAMDKPGMKILVHCQCGVSRSACVVVAYFMVKFKISVNEAYELLKSGTNNKAEPCSQQIKEAGNYVEACERICPNMSLIFELMDFGEKLEKAL